MQSQEFVDDELLTVRQVARILKMGERTIWRKSQAGQMPPPLRIGASVRFSRASLFQWISRGCPEQSATQDGANP